MFASNNDDTTNAAAKIDLLDMDRSPLLRGERGSSAKGKDPGRCRSSEIDLSRVLVQHHYVIGFGDC